MDVIDCLHPSQKIFPFCFLIETLNFPYTFSRHILLKKVFQRSLIRSRREMLDIVYAFWGQILLKIEASHGSEASRCHQKSILHVINVFQS